MNPEDFSVFLAIGLFALTFGAGGIGFSIASLLAVTEIERRRSLFDVEKKRLDAAKARLETENARLATENERLKKEIAPIEAGGGSPSRPTSRDEPESKAITGFINSKSVAYPEPEVVIPPESAFAVLPSARELPKIVGTAFPVAWDGPEFRRSKTVVVPSGEIADGSDGPVFVLGDLHGDAQSLRRILTHVNAVSDKAKVVFLGDLVDRSGGEETLECARLLVWEAKSRSGRVLWLRGNHDSLYWNEEKGMFASRSAPHEFADYLNANPSLSQEGRCLAAIMDDLPVAAVIGNVFLSHGGVLQDDDAGVRSFSGLSALTEAQISDFVWSRMRDVPTKLASRVSKGAEVGFRQAEKFAAKLRETDGLEVLHIVCGHQHEAKDGYGYLPFERKFSQRLTCQCVTSFFNRDASQLPARPAILRLDGENTPFPILFPSPD